MATFKVGQRVRIVQHIFVPQAGGKAYPDAVGREATILRLCLQRPFDWVIQIDNIPGEALAQNAELAPLTDPGADAFIESLKKLKHYEEPRVPKDAPVPLSMVEYRGEGPDGGFWVRD